MKKILTFIIIIHLAGTMLYRIYAEYEFKNENSFITSTFFAEPVALFKAFFWEYHLLKKSFSKDFEPDNYLFKTVSNDVTYYIIRDNEKTLVESYKGNKFYISAYDINGDIEIDRCFSDFKGNCEFGSPVLNSAQYILAYYTLGIFGVLEAFDNDDFYAFTTKIDSMDKNYLPLLLNDKFLNQAYLESKPQFYNYIKSKI